MRRKLIKSESGQVYASIGPKAENLMIKGARPARRPNRRKKIAADFLEWLDRLNREGSNKPE